MYYVRQPAFTYFVDGAIYGFAAGIAFAVMENLLYLGQIGFHQGNDSGLVVLASARALSTSLMHGSASALVGVALGWLRFGRGLARFAALAGGWGAAILLHSAFNTLISNDLGGWSLSLAVLSGLSGIGLTVVLIQGGLREERHWLHDTLGQAAGVSGGEAAVLQELAQIDPYLRQAMAAEVAALRQQVDALRCSIGVYCMAYVRSILPSESAALWMRLGETLATPPMPAAATSTKPVTNLWRTLSNRIERRVD